ncbi:uncharacterized protein [Diadema setosum]|uniref:uncharacterized protein n=1 Tax=Diadema setosum TaxID=31175 RepID=UPI003B3AF263
MDETSREAELENYLDALTDFHKKPTKSIPSVLEQLLQRIARLGEPLFPWFKLKPLIVMKLENVIEEYIEYNPHEEVPILPNVENVRFDDMRERLLKALDSFNSAPFTIQRLCELLTEPKRYYRRSDKFMRGIEKNIQVVSTVTPSGKRITSLFDLEKSPPMVNGIVPESDASPSSDNNGFVRPDEAFNTSTSTSTSSSTSGSTSSNSGRADSLNGLSRPFYNSDPMDAPLQFAYPLSQNLTSPVTSMPSTDSSLRTDPSKVNGTHLELQEADAKETSEAVAEPNPQLEEAEKRTSEERMLLADENMEVDVTSEVSSSDTESFSGEPRKKEEGEEMEVDVASSGDGDVGRAGDSGGGGGDAAKEGGEKDEGEGVSTSESSGASVDTPMDREDSADDAGKADSSEGSKSNAPQQHGEELSANSEAAPSEEQAEEEERSPAREQAEGVTTDKPSQDEPTTQGELSQGEPSEGEPSQREASQAETEIQRSQEAGDVNTAGDAPGPADSSNDAKSMQTGVAEESPSGSSEAVSKDGAQETDDQIQGDDSSSRPPSDEDAVESSADAAVSTPGEPSAGTPADKAPGSMADPSSSDSTGDESAGQPSGEDQGGEQAGDQQQQQQQPPAQDAVSESTES